MAISRRRFVSLAGAMPVWALLPRALVAADSALPVAFTVGDFKKVYDPSIGETSPWYINDHTFVRAEDGMWHLFGITHQEPANPLDEKFFAHATAPDLLGPWTKQPPVLQADPKSETLVWAPYCFFYQGLYYMYYCAGSDDHTKYKIHLATSKDLSKWERSPANPMIVDGFDARDPMVLQVDDQWILYYCATSTPQGGHHTVKAAMSRDLLKWSDPIEVFRSPVEGSTGGPTESPFVVYREGKYYLFVCGENGYTDTTAYVSDIPTHWDNANKVGKAETHCAEIVRTPEGKWYISGAGWGHGGVDLAELTWKS